MKNLAAIYCLFCMTIISCNSENNNAKVKEPEATVVQAQQNDTLITVYEGVKPCRGCKQINTAIKFVRILPDTVGRFFLDESYLNKKDSVVQHYEGTGNYKILPASIGSVNGVALYNLILDNQTQGVVYLLEDSVTLVRTDAKGNPLAGDSAATLRKRQG